MHSVIIRHFDEMEEIVEIEVYPNMGFEDPADAIRSALQRYIECQNVFSGDKLEIECHEREGRRSRIATRITE